MTTQNVQVELTFGGGWATDFGPTAPVGLDQQGKINLPFLVDAENAAYDLDGGPHKIPGTTRVNATAIDAATVRGFTDFWVIGTAGSASQHTVAVVNADIYKDDDGAGSFTSITGSVTMPRW